MDTRTKILNVPHAIEAALQMHTSGQRVRVATGYFDPLLAEHARRLEAMVDEGAPLLVLVTEPHHPMLPIAARLELVAALSATTYVAAATQGELEHVLARLQPDDIMHLEHQDLRSRAALVDRIRERTAKA